MRWPAITLALFVVVGLSLVAATAGLMAAADTTTLGITGSARPSPPAGLSQAMRG